MAKSVYELAIALKGSADSSLGASIAGAKGQLKELDDQVKEIQEGRAKIGVTQSTFAQLNSQAQQYGETLGKLKLRQQDVSAYEKQRSATLDAANAYRKAQAEVQYLEKAHAQTGLPVFADALKKARTEATRTQKTYEKENKTLGDMKKRLSENGVNTRKLGEEKKRLASDIDKAAAAQARYAKSAQSLVQVRARVTELRGLFGKFTKEFMVSTGIVAGAITTAAGAGYGVASSVAAAGDEAVKTAKKLRMSTESFQEMQYAAGLSGVKDFNGALKTMAQNTSKAIGGQGKAVKAYKELGISAKQMMQMGPEKGLMVLADKMKNIQDPAKKARIALGLFGEQGLEMADFLGLGAKEVQALRDEAKRTGIVIPDAVGKSAEGFNDARDMMTASLRGLRNIVGAELIPVFTEMFKEMGTFFQENQTTVREFAKNLGQGFKKAVPAVRELLKGLHDLVGTFWNVGRAVTSFVGGGRNLAYIMGLLAYAKPIFTLGKIAGSVFKLSKELFGAKTAILAVGKAFMAHPMLLVVGALAAGAVWVVKNWDKVSAFFKDLWGKIERGAEAASAWVKDKWSAAADWFGELPGRISGFFSDLWGGVKTKASEAWESVKSTWNGAIDWFADLPGAIMKGLAGIVDSITTPFKKAFDAIENWWNRLKGWFSEPVRAEVEYKEVLTGAKTLHERRELGMKARGGSVSTHGLYQLAERGEEVVVPGNMADRGLGMLRLAQAEQMLGVGSGGNRGSGGGGAPITFSPTFHITGTNAQEIAQSVMATIKQQFPRMMREYEAQGLRLNYGV